MGMKLVVRSETSFLVLPSLICTHNNALPGSMHCNVKVLFWWTQSVINLTENL